jgi:hypothetical protein
VDTYWHGERESLIRPPPSVERHLEDTFGAFYKKRTEGKTPSVPDLINHSWQRMKISYGPGVRGKGYQEEEDAFLVCMMHRHGFGAAERIRMEIRRAWQFRFNWYIKSRTAVDLQKRCEILVKILERENEEVRKKEEEDEHRKKKPSAEKDRAEPIAQAEVV